jgi:hypothetical protein
MPYRDSQRIQKIKRKYGADAFKKFGRKGGSPILLSYALKKPVKGYRVTHS